MEVYLRGFFWNLKKFKVVITGIGGDELFGNYNRQFNYIDASKILSEENFNKFYFFNKLFLADNNFKKIIPI